jgi:uncharacterized membrane protein
MMLSPTRHASAVFIALTLLSNLAMWLVFSLALSGRGGSSLGAAAASTAGNLLATGLLAAGVLGEAVSLEWAVGAACLAAGVAVLA